MLFHFFENLLFLIFTWLHPTHLKSLPLKYHILRQSVQFFFKLAPWFVFLRYFILLLWVLAVTVIICMTFASRPLQLLAKKLHEAGIITVSSISVILPLSFAAYTKQECTKYLLSKWMGKWGTKTLLQKFVSLRLGLSSSLDLEPLEIAKRGLHLPRKNEIPAFLKFCQLMALDPRYGYSTLLRHISKLMCLISHLCDCHKCVAQTTSVPVCGMNCFELCSLCHKGKSPGLTSSECTAWPHTEAVGDCHDVHRVFTHSVYLSELHGFSINLLLIFFLLFWD